MTSRFKARKDLSHFHKGDLYSEEPKSGSLLKWVVSGGLCLLRLKPGVSAAWPYVRTQAEEGLPTQQGLG